MTVYCPTHMTRACAFISDRRFYFDRVNLLMPTVDPDLDVESLAGFTRMKAALWPMQQTYHPHIKSRLELFQPTPKILRRVSESIGAAFAPSVSRIEVAADFIARSERDARQIGWFILTHLWRPHLRRPVVFDHATVYWGTHHESGVSIALYWDRPSKVTREPCAHLEVRIIGSDYAANFGIHSLDDLYQLNQPKMVMNAVRLLSLTKVELGRWCSGLTKSPSRQALTKRADKYLREEAGLLHKGRPIVHNVRRACVEEGMSAVEIGRVFQEIDVRPLFGDQSE